MSLVVNSQSGLISSPQLPKFTCPVSFTFWAWRSGNGGAGSELCVATWDVGSPYDNRVTAGFNGAHTDLGMSNQTSFTTNFVTSPATGAWFFYALTSITGVNGQTAYWASYGDTSLGANIAIADGPANCDFWQLSIGTGNGADTNWWNGRLANVKIWNAQLGGVDLINEMYQYTPARKQGLVGWYPLIGLTAADCCQDYSGMGPTLIVKGSPTIGDNPPIPWGKGGRTYHPKTPAAAPGQPSLAWLKA